MLGDGVAAFFLLKFDKEKKKSESVTKINLNKFLPLRDTPLLQRKKEDKKQSYVKRIPEFNV